MNIGLTRKSYPETRCITTSSEHNYIFQKYFNATSYLKRVPLLDRKVREFIFIPIYNPKVDLYHSFNDICITKKKWVATYETMIPRFKIVDGYHREKYIDYPYNEIVNSYLEKIAAPNCLATIAISQATYKIQEKMLSSYPDLKYRILDKTKVIYPPQKVLASNVDIYKKGFDKLKLIFVGSDFYRKGGSEIVIAVDELISEQKISENDIDVTLIGDLKKYQNYALNEFQDNDDYFNIIESTIKSCKNIKLISKIENKKLLQLIKESDIGLLPTWADTFGYSVLEFQASGCPVISTNVRALPEINNSQIGWVINIDTNDFGEVVIDSEEKKLATRRVIINGLKSTIVKCLKDKETIRQKAIKALQRIEEVHSIEKYNKKLTQIYNQ